MSEILAIAASYCPFEAQDLKMLVLSSCTWLSMYIFVTYIPIPLKNKYGTLSRKDELDIQNRVISAIHGTVLFVFGGYEFYFNPG